jgi:shikimate dehydrogenase|tara:strand:- start:630 stop:1463 length:834 start_codon:yes stop_codon:yes gene_type:complete
MTKKAGVIGWPVSHSLSPRLHGFWLKKYSINGSYNAIEINPNNLEKFIKDLSFNGFTGLNVTVPYKETVAKLVHVLDENSCRLGAVNTLVVGSDNLIYGSNTDGFGFMQNLIANAPQWKSKNSVAVVLGAGGAAKSIISSLINSGISEIRLTNRTYDEAISLKNNMGSSIKVFKWKNRSNILNDIELLVNTTTLGMIGKPPLDIDLNGLPSKAVVMDIVYSPLITPLLEEAKYRSNPVINGIGMLLHQARPGFHQWFGLKPEVTKELENYVLLGAQS